MSFDLRELYQEVILDHNRNPRNRGTIADSTASAEGYNPLCGDAIRLTLKLENDRVEAIAFEGHGCAISTASASLMTEAVKGKSVEEARAIFREFQEMVTETESPTAHEDLGELEALAGVRDLPVRIKCATLAWHTLSAALEGKKEASTE